jgi:hypothetical protein
MLALSRKAPISRCVIHRLSSMHCTWVTMCREWKLWWSCRLHLCNTKPHFLSIYANNVWNRLHDTHPPHSSPPFFSTYKVQCDVNLANFISKCKELKRNFPLHFKGTLYIYIYNLFFKNYYYFIFKILFLKIAFCFVLDHDLKPAKSWYYRKAFNKMVWCAPWLFHNLWINRALIRLIIFIENSLEFTKKMKIVLTFSSLLFLIFLPFTTHGEMHEKISICSFLFCLFIQKIAKMIFSQLNFFVS